MRCPRHAMVPAVGSHVRYQYAGALQTLGQVKFNCQVPGRRPLLCYGPDQIRAAFALTLGRPPASDEAREWLDYATRHGMTNFVRMLLNSNEFLFVN